MSTEDKCMVHGCSKDCKGGARGLCLTHYKMLLRAVDNGDYTWSALEKMGACKPSAVVRNPEDKQILASFLTGLVNRQIEVHDDPLLQPE